VVRFCAACERWGLTPYGLTRLDLLRYLAELAQQGYAASTRARTTVAIRRFFQCLAEAGVLPYNPFARVPAPPLERQAPRVLTEAEDAALGQLAQRESPRTWAIVAVLRQTGLRASELCGLCVGDVTLAQDGQPGQLVVRQGKGKQDRVVPLPAPAQEAVQASLATHANPRPEAPLLVRPHAARPLTRQALGSLITRLGARAGLREVSPQTFRHTFLAQRRRLRMQQEPPMPPAPPPLLFEELPLLQARTLGRGPWLDPVLHQALREQMAALSTRAVRMRLPRGVNTQTMRARILRVARELQVPVTVRRVADGVIFWRSTPEDLAQAQAVAARLPGAQRRHTRPGHQR